MSNWKCGRCGVVYSFEEWMTLGRVKAVPDDPDPKKNYGYTMVCKHCGYVFHHDKPIWKTHGEINHRITVLDRTAHRIDVRISTVFLELAHDEWDLGIARLGSCWGEASHPNWYESMIFCSREGERHLADNPDKPEDWEYDKATPEERRRLMTPIWVDGVSKVESWVQRRYHTEEQAIEGHKRLTKLLREGKYLITYALERVDYQDPHSKYRFEWRLDLDERHRRFLHGAKVHEEWEGTTKAYREDHVVVTGKTLSGKTNVG
ncbi:hypothetical protein LCGC14_1836050 [marine sediment metagenome]|uniref:Uncharacterized protein n=1 Tax=marine sediment metagenome TaxID=412755 RepID=A0A0F9JE80_9ZZZZ